MQRTMLLALLAATALSSPAFAQENADEVVVTATRTPASADRLPAQVDVIDIEQARERGRLTIDDALQDTPGIQVPRTGPVGQQTSIFSGGFESNHTLVLFDGMRIDDPSTPEGIFDAGQDMLGDAARIEVVQGPFSALYGSGALGGVVNILPRRGGEGALNPSLDVAAGSFDTLTATAGVDGTLGRLRYALNAEGYASEGYDTVPERMTTHTGEEDGADIATFTGVLDLDLTDTLALDVLLRQRKADVETDYDPFGNITETDSAIESETAVWRLGATWAAADDFSLRLRGGSLDTDRTNFAGGAISDEFHGIRDFADLSATWTLDRWTLIAGGESENEEIDAVSFGSPITGEQEHWGAYLAAQAALGPLDVTAAVRHDDFDGFGGETTWRAGASYNIGEATRVYAAYGSSYRAPSLYERFVPFFGNAALEPESAETWEAGAETAFALFGQDRGLELAALYRTSEVEDLIGFGLFTYVNVDRADIDYAEARIALRPASWLTGRVVYGDTDAVNAATGVALARRPEQAWSAEIEVERGPFSAHLAWRHVGERRDTTYSNSGACCGSGVVPEYDVVNASLAWSVNDAVRLYVAGNNVTDETYEAVNGFAGPAANVMFGVRVSPTRSVNRADR
jgi:vitamin B12 transporter